MKHVGHQKGKIAGSRQSIQGYIQVTRFNGRDLNETVDVLRPLLHFLFRNNK